MRWPKYWSFSLSISPSNQHPGLISFRLDCVALLAVQGTLKSLLQHHNPKASIFRCSAFFTVQLSHPYMTTGKTTALTRRTFVGKVMSLLFNMLSRLVTTFLPRGKHLLISWLQSPSAVILAPPPQNKVWHCFHCFPVYFPWNEHLKIVKIVISLVVQWLKMWKKNSSGQLSNIESSGTNIEHICLGLAIWVT